MLLTAQRGIDSAQKGLYSGGVSENREAPPGISAEDWAATPVSVRELVMRLLALVERLQQRVADWEERLNQTSRNSSKPPSSDPPQVAARWRREPSGRAAGGQPGHEGHGRALKAAEQGARIVEVRPVSWRACGALLLGEDPAPARHQVTELPRVEPEVTEYRRHRLRCLVCGESTTAPWPQERPTGCFGPRVQARVGYVTGRVGASQRDVEEILETVFHTPVGLGSIPALEADVSAAVAEPVAQAPVYVQQQPVNHVDETSWREGRQRTWLWINTTPLVTMFRLIATRSAEGAKQVLSPGGQEDRGVGSLVGLPLVGSEAAATVLGASEA